MDELLGAYGSDSEGSGAEGHPAGPESPEGGEDFFGAPAAAPPPLPVPQPPPPGPGRTGAGAAVPADLLQAARFAQVPQWRHLADAGPRRQGPGSSSGDSAGGAPNGEEIDLGSSSSSAASSSSEDEGAGGAEEDDEAGRKLDAIIKEKGFAALDGGSDDENPPRTRNEAEDLGPVAPVDVEVSASTPVEAAGVVSAVVGHTVVVAGLEGRGPYADGSVFCLEDRTVLGRVEDVFGPVASPFYSLRCAEVPAAATPGRPVLCVLQHSAVLDPQSLHTKGYDMSGKDDEELSGSDREFSDDEVEQAARRKAKAKRKAARS